jgi:hypothetical protein
MHVVCTPNTFLHYQMPELKLVVALHYQQVEVQVEVLSPQKVVGQEVAQLPLPPLVLVRGVV